MNQLRRQRRILGVASLSACLLAGVSAASGQQSHPSGVSEARAVEVLAKAKRALAGKGDQDPTAALARLAIVAPTLNGRLEDQATGLLARPTSKDDPQNQEYRVKEEKPFCSPHFCVHWVEKTKDAPSLKDPNRNGIPEFVERAAGIAEAAHLVENGTLGWRLPKPDGRLGGNGKTDIYLAQLGFGFFGYAVTDPKQQEEGAPPLRSQHSYLVIDNNFSRAEFQAPPNKSLQVTLAHEYNHVLQFSYDIFQDVWAGEATATWIEDRVFPAADDYFRYLKAWAARTQVPLTRFTNAKVYGSAVWNHWLASVYGPDVVRQMWAGATKSRPGGLAASSYTTAIAAVGNSTFQRAFARFAADTAEWRLNGVFPEGIRYPEIKRSGTLRSGQGTARRLDHTGYQLIDVKVPKGGMVMKLNVKVAGQTSAGIALIGRRGRGNGATVVVTHDYLKNGGRGSVSLPAPSGYSRITAMVANTDVDVLGYAPRREDWVYRADDAAFRVSVKAGR